MAPCNEINALNDVYESLSGLDNAQIKRILNWVKDRFELDKPPGLKAEEREVETETPKKTITKPVVDEPDAQLAESPVIQGFLKYDSFEELFLFSKANTNTVKILLAAAYLQVKMNLKEFVCNEINTLYKDLGEEVSNISSTLSNLMCKDPSLVIQTGTEGTVLKARRKFRVTEEGLRIAVNYIKE
jgi:hypothetical protein